MDAVMDHDGDHLHCDGEHRHPDQDGSLPTQAVVDDGANHERDFPMKIPAVVNAERERVLNETSSR
jgi:hypothetical protein